MIKKDSVLLC